MVPDGLGLLYAAVGVVLLVGARRLSTWKSNRRKEWYERHPRAAQANRLSRFAGTEVSIRTGAVLWRIIGALLVAVGVLRVVTPVVRG